MYVIVYIFYYIIVDYPYIIVYTMSIPIKIPLYKSLPIPNVNLLGSPLPRPMGLACVRPCQKMPERGWKMLDD